MVGFTLYRERLTQILVILRIKGGSVSVRDFARSYGVSKWEIEQARDMGFVILQLRKPRTGRPSLQVSAAADVSKRLPQNHLPYKAEVERPISVRHLNFAIDSTLSTVPGGSRCSWMPLGCTTDAYQMAFRRARGRRAATASASRLRKHPDVRAARRWFRAALNHETVRSELIPDTRLAIERRLRELGVTKC